MSQKASTNFGMLCKRKSMRPTGAPRKYLPTLFKLSQSLSRGDFIALDKEMGAKLRSGRS
eukprot:1754366-Heterocapsa_arctica.AAC.1